MMQAVGDLLYSFKHINRQLAGFAGINVGDSILVSMHAFMDTINATLEIFDTKQSNLNNFVFWAKNL